MNGIGGQRGLGLSLRLVNGSERQTSGTRGRGRRVTPSGLGSGGAGVGPGVQAPAEGEGGEDDAGAAEVRPFSDLQFTPYSHLIVVSRVAAPCSINSRRSKRI